jgi:hypothetical protein
MAISIINSVIIQEMKLGLNYEIWICFKIITFGEIKNSETASEQIVVTTKELTIF